MKGLSKNYPATGGSGSNRGYHPYGECSYSTKQANMSNRRVNYSKNAKSSQKAQRRNNSKGH